MASVRLWAREQFRVYFDNANSTREFRAQMRAGKTPWLLGAFLGVLVLVGLAFYIGISQEARTVSDLQDKMRYFYGTIIYILAALVTMVAPVLAASSIVGEYQRRSIELVFSSPVSAKYFLVGKLLSAFRYVLMLLVVTLPVASMSIVMGGSTWVDVLSAYGVLALHGLLLMAFSVPIAVLTCKTVSTVIWAYAASFMFYIQSMIFIAPMLGGMSGGSNPQEQPFTVLMVPFALPMVSSTYSVLYGVHVPNIVLLALFVGLLTKLFLVGAGSVLSQAGSKETVSLRIHGLVAAAVFGLLVSVPMSASMAIGAMGGRLPPMIAIAVSLSSYILIVLPYLSTFTLSRDPKAFHNGWFSPKLLLRGSPASGLPYLLLLCLVWMAAMMFPALGSMAFADVFPYLAAFFAGWTFLWSLGRVASVMSPLADPSTARRLHIVLILGVFLVPSMFLPLLNLDPKVHSALNLTNILVDDTTEVLGKAGVMLLLSAVFCAIGERTALRMRQEI